MIDVRITAWRMEIVMFQTKYLHLLLPISVKDVNYWTESMKERIFSNTKYFTYEKR